MPARRKQEGDTGLLECSHHLLQGRLQLQAQPFEHVSGTHLAAGAAIAVLGHHHTAGRSGEGHGRGDVETVGPIATGSAGIHQGQ